MKLSQLKDLIVRNWKEKLLSLVLAFLFWFMIKGHAARTNIPYGYGSERFGRSGLPQILPPGP
ncbi:MAG: hypothetical protein LDL31_08420 [Prosthecobacter sp.]|nr:hypothetical protein [Prosthecobacter sp.]